MRPKVLVVNNPVWLDEFRRVGWPVPVWTAELVCAIIHVEFGHMFMCSCERVIPLHRFVFPPGRVYLFGYCPVCNRFYRDEPEVIPMRDVTPREYRRLVEGTFDE